MNKLTKLYGRNHYREVFFPLLCSVEWAGEFSFKSCCHIHSILSKNRKKYRESVKNNNFKKSTKLFVCLSKSFI